MHIKKFLTGILLLFFSLSSGMDNEKNNDQSRQIVLYKNVHELKAAKTLKKHSLFVFNCLDSVCNLNTSSGYFPQELSVLTKKNFVCLYLQEISDKNFHLKGLSERQKIGVAQLNAINSWQNDIRMQLNFSSEDIDGIKAVPRDILGFSLEKEKRILIELPWYKPSVNQKKYIYLSGFAGGLVGGVMFLGGICCFNGGVLLPIKDCAGLLSASVGVGILMGAGVMYLVDVVCNETKRYDQYRISPDSSAKSIIRWIPWNE